MRSQGGFSGANVHRCAAAYMGVQPTPVPHCCRGGEGAAANRERGSSPTPPGVTVAADVAAGASSSGVGHSTPSDLLAALQKQLEEKDRVIGELRQQVHELQLAAAQREAEGSHDAGRASQAV